jgi:spermidine/putrescine-binding protein
VVAQRRAAVSSKATGRLLDLRVREGSTVKAGDLIARLDASDVQAAVQSAQEQLWNFMEQNVGDVSIELRSFSTLRRDRVNPNVEVVQPTEGQPVAMNFACIPVGARHQAAAEEWINRHLSVAVQTRYAQEIYFGPTNSEVRLPADLASRVISSQAEVESLMSFDIQKVNQRVQMWSSRYNREIVGA